MRMTKLAFFAALIASLTALPAMAQSTNDSATGDAAAGHEAHDMAKDGQMDNKMVETPATVNKVSDDSLNVTHPAIPAIKWPAMTMDIPLTEDAEIAEVSDGDKVIIVLVQKEDGNYAIKSAKKAAE